jgi:hypothetical protein
MRPQLFSSLKQYVDQQQGDLDKCERQDAAGKAIPSNFQLCDGGDLHATKLLVLIGDSHALMWFRFFSTLGIRFHFRVKVLAMPSCAPFDDGHPATHGCLAFRQSMRQQVKELQPDFLALSWFWKTSFQKHPYPVFSESVDSMLRLLRQSCRVLYINDVPFRSASVPEMISTYPTAVNDNCATLKMVCMSTHQLVLLCCVVFGVRQSRAPACVLSCGRVVRENCIRVCCAAEAASTSRVLCLGCPCQTRGGEPWSTGVGNAGFGVWSALVPVHCQGCLANVGQQPFDLSVLGLYRPHGHHPARCSRIFGMTRLCQCHRRTHRKADCLDVVNVLTGFERDVVQSAKQIKFYDRFCVQRRVCIIGQRACVQ